MQELQREDLVVGFQKMKNIILPAGKDSIIVHKVAYFRLFYEENSVIYKDAEKQGP